MEMMNPSFTAKVRSAAIAGWWTLLIIGLYDYLQYFVYLRVSVNPAWMLSLMGMNIDWLFLQRIWLMYMMTIKFFFLFVLCVDVWLTIWAHRLKKHGD